MKLLNTNMSVADTQGTIRRPLPAAAGHRKHHSESMNMNVNMNPAMAPSSSTMSNTLSTSSLPGQGAQGDTEGDEDEKAGAEAETEVQREAEAERGYIVDPTTNNGLGSSSPGAISTSATGTTTGSNGTEKKDFPGHVGGSRHAHEILRFLTRKALPTTSDEWSCRCWCRKWEQGSSIDVAPFFFHGHVHINVDVFFKRNFLVVIYVIFWGVTSFFFLVLKYFLTC
ncbi:hypothetical protein FB446DRAFT_794681 [Lentinula raphanica]|nr:hypothetical protein FB446DRAFT_794681 [Lentinula raphanica]